MLADFAVRLAFGMTACLLLLSPASSARPAPGEKPLAHPNFFRTHLLIVLGLSCLAALFPGEAPYQLPLLVAACGLAALGSAAWMLERSPRGVSLIVLAAAALLAALVLREPNVVGGLTSALLLGAAMSAMLMGHNYLVAPAMSLVPLFRLLAALAVALVLRAVADGAALAGWAQAHGFDTLKADAMLWLPVRWLVGIAGPAAMCWMAWQTARIRSTQSATGILYVAVIFCFLGELTGMLLRPSGVVL
ncbi:MAG: hypothetical protein K2W96_20170 [Gemmataceae bacterium]|nr:hypothetical protein [Gemmataceae bacterium]